MLSNQQQDDEERYSQDESNSSQSRSLARAKMPLDEQAKIAFTSLSPGRITDGLPTLPPQEEKFRPSSLMIAATAIMLIVILVFIAFIVVLPKFTTHSSPARLTPPQTIGIYKPGTNVNASSFFLKNTIGGEGADETIIYGNSQDIPIVGNWTGNGVDYIGVYDPTTSTFFLATSNEPGANATFVFQFGVPQEGDIPIAGDWTGTGKDSIGLYNPVTSTFYLKNTLSGGSADKTFQFGKVGTRYRPIAGNWKGTNTDGIGLYDPATGTFYIKDTLPSAIKGIVADEIFQFGSKNWIPLVGDWRGTGKDSIGVYNPQNAMFYLRYTLNNGYSDNAINFGDPGESEIPLVGHWVQ